MSYAFRIRFARSPTDTIETEASEWRVPISGTQPLFLKAHQAGVPIRDSDQLVLLGEGYSCEAEALESGRQCEAALMVALARVRVGADFGARSAKGVVTRHGLAWFEEQFGQRALNDVHGLMVFPTEPKPKFASITATLTRGTSFEPFTKALLAAISARPTLTERDMLALALFNASFFQRSADSRFVLLVMAVEALIDPAPRSAEAREHVDGLITQTRSSSLSEAEKQSIIGALHWLRNESINSAGRRLASARSPGKFYQEKSPTDFFSHCYQLRSNLVHGNLPFPTFEEVGAAAATLEVFVSDLLTGPFLGNPT